MIIFLILRLSSGSIPVRLVGKFTKLKQTWTPTLPNIQVKVKKLYFNFLTLLFVSSGEKLYTCSVCGKSYRFWGGFDNCLRRHSGDMRYACEKCGKTFNSAFRLSLHMRIHDGVRPFKCPSCPYDCSRRDNLITHMKRTHHVTAEEVRQLLTVPTTSEAA